METEGEGIAFVVCNSIGLNTNSASRDYVQLYREDKETLISSFHRIKDNSARIIGGVGLKTTIARTP